VVKTEGGHMGMSNTALAITFCFKSRVRRSCPTNLSGFTFQCAKRVLWVFFFVRSQDMQMGLIMFLLECLHHVSTCPLVLFLPHFIGSSPLPFLFHAMLPHFLYSTKYSYLPTMKINPFPLFLASPHPSPRPPPLRSNSRITTRSTPPSTSGPPETRPCPWLPQTWACSTSSQ